MKKLFIYLAIFITTCLSTRGIALAEPVTVYAAASLTSALQDLSKTAEKQGLPLRLSFAGSSILAKQIALGAPADIYLSANVKWMDFLAKEKLLEPNTRINLLGNALVIIAPKDEIFEVKPQADFDFPSAFEGPLALGDPSHVPAGIYATEALKNWTGGHYSKIASPRQWTARRTHAGRPRRMCSRHCLCHRRDDQRWRRSNRHTTRFPIEHAHCLSNRHYKRTTHTSSPIPPCAFFNQTQRLRSFSGMDSECWLQSRKKKGQGLDVKN